MQQTIFFELISFRQSSLFKFVHEGTFRYERHFDLTLIEKLHVQSFLSLSCTAYILRLKANPDMSIRPLLYEDFVNFSKILTDLHNLVLNVNEKRGILFQINSSGVE